MPGIAGVITRPPLVTSDALARAMVASMLHEPSCLSGMHTFKQMGISVGWVGRPNGGSGGKILWNARKTIGLALAGEIFNEEITCRDHAYSRGSAVPAGKSLISLYEEGADRFFTNLNGLFAGLLVDLNLRKAFLFNDRYGLERVYLHETNDCLYFASEAKALLRVLPQTRAFDYQGVTQFLAFGCPLEQRTLFQGISRLPGGSLWTFTEREPQKKQYFSPIEWESQERLSEKEFECRFHETFSRILPRYFQADERLGISLTGGLDTRMIMACTPPAGDNLISYTFSGATRATLDAQLAAKVAAASNIEHQTIPLQSEFLREFDTHLDRTVWLTDGCLGVLGAHEVYLNRQARDIAEIRLTGNYGSEILRSASTLKPIALSNKLFADASDYVKAARTSPLKEYNHPVSAAAFCEIPCHLYGYFSADRSQVQFRTPYLDNEVVSLAFQAPDLSRKSPRVALSLIERFGPQLARIPTDQGHLQGDQGIVGLLSRLRHKVEFKFDYWDCEALPTLLSPLDNMLDRMASTNTLIGTHKYLPYRRWFRRQLATVAKERVINARAQEASLWNSDFLCSMVDDHIQGRANYLREISVVVTLEAIERLLFRSSGQLSVDSRREFQSQIGHEVCD